MADNIYGADYFLSHCGLPYTRDEPHWAAFFGTVARHIDEKLAPSTVFDAGCAIGFLVEALRSRGIEAFGRDFSEYAISQVPVGLAPFCDCGSIAEPIPGQFDLVTCIEVLEHMPTDEGCRAIANLCGAAPRVFFSSSPTDFAEPTHINVQPPRHWMERFAEHGFAPRADFDGSFLCPWAILFERREDRPTAHELDAQARVVLTRMEKANHAAAVGADIAELRARVDTFETKVWQELATHNEEIRSRVDAFQTKVSQHLTLHGQELANHRALVSDMKQAIEALADPGQSAARRKRKR